MVVTVATHLHFELCGHRGKDSGGKMSVWAFVVVVVVMVVVVTP